TLLLAHVECIFVFFFSSRRRHTRSKRDWSSDVCSSDLDLRHCLPDPAGGRHRRVPHPGALGALRLGALPGEGALRGADEELPPEIGRATCREREEIWEDAVKGKGKHKTKQEKEVNKTT